MADMLRITTPLIEKNQGVTPKTQVSPTAPFDIQNPSKVMPTQNQNELLKQNTGMLQGSDAPVMLLNLLKDPAVAVSYLKNIFLLEELFKLMPANNKTMTAEIEQIFESLLMQSDEVKQEMVRQGNASTLFQGELFDFLRELSDINRSVPRVQIAIATLLKSINNLLCKDDIFDAVANSLLYLKDSLASSPALSQKLEALMTRFRHPDAQQNFEELKEQTLALLKEVEGSILFSPKQSKVLSIIVYNLSRYHNSMEFFHESAFRLRELLTVEQRKPYAKAIELFLSHFKQGLYSLQTDQNPVSSKVMDALIQLVEQHSSNQTVAAADAAKIDKILHSLLSSPCNFTPLLHFIVPVVHGGLKAFAEIWINPESDEKDMPTGVESGKHFLLVIEVGSIGRFEAELFVYGKTIDFHLYCPIGYENKYEVMMKNLPKALKGLPYRLGNTKVEPLGKSRSLMDVFKSLPYKRVGVDVKI